MPRVLAKKLNIVFRGLCNGETFCWGLAAFDNFEAFAEVCNFLLQTGKHILVCKGRQLQECGNLAYHTRIITSGSYYINLLSRGSQRLRYPEYRSNSITQGGWTGHLFAILCGQKAINKLRELKFIVKFSCTCGFQSTCTETHLCVKP